MMMLVLFVHALRVLLRFTRPYSLKILDFIYRIIFGTKPILPPINDKILLTPAVELAKKIRKKQLKSEDVVKAYIKRIKEVDPIINACLDQRFEEALKEANGIDIFISNTTKSEDEIERDTPLLGVPFSTKEFLGVKGMAQTIGCYKYKDRKAECDGDCPALYRKAGAIPLTVTNVPEYVFFWDSTSYFGRTFNPYDNVRSAGGTSGGEAALLASAGAVIGVGSDLAGSIRVPAAFNGVYAHNPSPGMISNKYTWPPIPSVAIKPFIKVGPMCRYLKDLPLLVDVLSEGRIKFDKKAAEFFEITYSNKPKKICIPELKFASEIEKAYLVEFDKSIRRFVEEDKPINLFLEFIKFIFGKSEHTLPTLYLTALANQKKDQNHQKYLAMFDVLKSKLDSVLDEDCALLIPTHPEPAVHHLMSIPKYGNKAYTCITNYFGYPALQMPAGFSDGLPIGLQILCKQSNDYLCILTAIELEQVFGGWRSPSEITL